ncbi:DNA-directed RNA polymerase subunit D, partial [Candidatus Woesearchaeota archaeon]
MIEGVQTDKRTGRVSFTLKANVAVANTLRRIMMESVPTMAIHEVEFIKNDSALYDEMLAHRLGLIPLTTDLKSYEIKKENEEYTAKNSLKLFLKAKGPCTVYAEQLESQDPKVKAAHPKTPIVKLLKGQELEFQATAILGVGKDHTKFAPCKAWYTQEYKVSVKNDHPDFEEYKNKYPKAAFAANGKIDPKLIEKHNLYDACKG